MTRLATVERSGAATTSDRRCARTSASLLSQAVGEDDELVAGEARDEVVGAHAPDEPLGDADEHLVADRVTERVVDHLEVVEVDEQHRERLAARRRPAPRAGARGPAGRFGSPRERVVLRLVDRVVEQWRRRGRAARAPPRGPRPAAARARGRAPCRRPARARRRPEGLVGAADEQRRGRPRAAGRRATGVGPSRARRCVARPPRAAATSVVRRRAAGREADRRDDLVAAHEGARPRRRRPRRRARPPRSTAASARRVGARRPRGTPRAAARSSCEPASSPHPTASTTSVWLWKPVMPWCARSRRRCRSQRPARRSRGRRCGRPRA